MASLDDIADALRNAHAAGDEAAATKLADAYTALKAQQSAPPGAQPATEPAGKAAGRRATEFLNQVNTPFGKLGDLTAGVANFGNTVGFGLPAKIADTLTGSKGTLEGINEAADPLVTGASSLGGAVLGGSGLERAALPVIERAAPTIVKGVRSLLTLKAGQPVANAARLAGQGALGGGAYGAASGGVQGGPEGAVEGAAEGAAAGAVGGPVAAGVGKGVQAVVKALAPASERAIAVLAKNLDETPTALKARMAEFKAANGRNATVADLINTKSVANLEPVTTAKQSAQAAMQAADRANTAALPARLSQRVARGGPTDTTSNLDKVRKDAFDSAMTPIADKPVPLPTKTNAEGEQEIDLPPKLARAIANDVNDNADPQAADLLENGQITMRTLDNVRQALNARHASKPGHNYDKLAQQITALGAQAHPEYGQALDEFGQFSRTLKGYEHGLSDTDAGTLKGGDRKDATTPEYLAGRAIGERTRLANNAAGSERGAQSTAEELRQAAHTSTGGTSALPDIRALSKAGANEVRSQQNYGTLAGRGLPSKSAEKASAVQGAAEGAVATVGHTLTGFKTHAAFRILRQMGVRESTAQDVVRVLTDRDPAAVAQLPARLRQTGISEAQQRKVLALVARRAGAGAAATAQAVTQ